MGVLTLLLLACVCAGWGGAHLMDNLVGGAGLPTCPALLHAAHRRHLHAAAPMPPPIRGRWLSSRCETRPGPLYVLRSYTFHRDGSFLLSLHTYRDPSCAQPSRTLVARGNLTLGRPSWITPGGTEADYTLSKVEVIGHSHLDAATLATSVNATCPGKVTKPWKPHKSYVVLSYAEAANEVTEDEDCSSGLGGAWNELQLVRVEVTQGQGSKVTKKELFLGDLHTDQAKQDLYRPTGYQTPLLHVKYAGSCGGVCTAVERGTDRSPPHLHASPDLPLLLAGSWASRRCETRPYGMFLTRLLEFSPSRRRWTMTLRHYHDPECSRPSFTLQASGTHAPAPAPDLAAAPRHAPRAAPHAHDFNVTRLLLTPDDEYLTRALNLYGEEDCGARGSWGTGVVQDVTPGGGCAAVGVRVPALEREIVRTGVDEAGRMWLALGQTPTARTLAGAWQRRPTSWGPELTSCRGYHAYHHDNTLVPVVGARTASSGPSLQPCTALPLLLAALLALIHGCSGTRLALCTTQSESHTTLLSP